MQKGKQADQSKESCSQLFTGKMHKLDFTLSLLLRLSFCYAHYCQNKSPCWKEASLQCPRGICHVKVSRNLLYSLMPSFNRCLCRAFREMLRIQRFWSLRKEIKEQGGWAAAMVFQCNLEMWHWRMRVWSGESEHTGGLMESVIPWGLEDVWEMLGENVKWVRQEKQSKPSSEGQHCPGTPVSYCGP